MLDFQKEVIDKSQEIPVLVDFWASWCGPCKTLGPILDQLSEEQSEKWDFVKVNTEEHQELSSQYKIRSIPNVKLFFKGDVIGEFMGALPKTQIEQWLKDHIPSEEDINVKSIMENPDISIAEKARQLEAVLDVFPDKDEIKIAVSLHSMFSHPERAIQLIEGFKMSHSASSSVQMVKDVAGFMLHQNEENSPFDDTLKEAQIALKKEDWEEGVKKLIDLVSIDKSYEKDMPRKTTIGVFQFLGPKHPVTVQYRRMFDMILW